MTAAGSGSTSSRGWASSAASARITALPNPNELYLRVVEEMYEPRAVEARLGDDPFNPYDEGPH
ncbi:hypothetical protein [Paractinoplanes durhamensis]|uniref:Uncharacterized protein n=1 Tax=Paractinoplanes durhamensis TaxID=113563 RepID=A0ABQ3Z354_9ACTN|nr:hypothetical protein [Actinoplanes durhamensis]GIE04252.1 hypothetical protein Adu01nite_56020 [Actinoplanes durhamensis]